ncbi:MAG: L-arabinose isomerase [Planctomycetota bacterium]
MNALPDLSELEVWLAVGSQHLYGEETLANVAADARVVAQALDAAAELPVRVVREPTVTTPDDARRLVLEANASPACVGLIAWMHTFSPAKMWIGGLGALDKPLLHLHTQFGRELPWATIDMDFMNLHQSAHGGREFGFVCTRLGVARKVVVGHWSDDAVKRAIGVWSRAAAARHDWRTARIARIGDNMREVSVTEGDKVAAEQTFGFAVNGHGVGGLAALVNSASDADVDHLCSEYDATYSMAPELRSDGARRQSLRDAARIELGLRAFLADVGACGFTDTFEDLVGLKQLPGIAAQRLMADGYGFGAEGDWKAAALTRAAKVMATGLPGGVSFMEDYTYHLPESGDDLVLGSHMLEICPSIAAAQPTCEVHPLAIGGKEDPVRLVFDAAPGQAVNASLIDLGNRFRVVLGEVESVPPPAPLPNLPVARAVWKPKPSLRHATSAWIEAGGSHHPTYATALTAEHYLDLARMVGVELVRVDE